MKTMHVKPSLYAFCYETLKKIAASFGYNLVLHGSMNRDLDLIAIPWQEDVLNHEEMIKEFADKLGGNVMGMTHEQKHCFPHGRLSYVINLNRGEKLPSDNFTDPMYYLDISVIQPVFTTNPKHTEAMVSQSALSSNAGYWKERCLLNEKLLVAYRLGSIKNMGSVIDKLNSLKSKSEPKI